MVRICLAGISGAFVQLHVTHLCLDTKRDALSPSHPNSRHNTVAIAAIALATLISVLAATPALALRAGQKAPALTLCGLAGDTVRVADPASPRPAALLFWATWCSTCRREIPRLAGVIREARERGVPFYAIALESRAADVRRFLD